MNERPMFILAGNGPYENRGCEAIVRGTVKILRNHYKDPSFLCLSHFQNHEQFEKQIIKEYDSEVIHRETNRNKKMFSPEWACQFIQRKFSEKKYMRSVYKELFPAINEAEAVLSVGGDNYSLDYGIPRAFTGLDDLVLENKKPMIIWGASVGPFDRVPEYEKYMKKHLQRVNGIFVRESATIEYLEKIGVKDNIYKTADPAFLMDPQEPQPKIKIEEESIGINLSPLMAKYVGDKSLESWINIAAGVLEEVIKRTENKLYLIPHVTIPISNDYLFLKQVKEKIKDSEERTVLIPPIYNASETKWIISKMKVFAGARTHSTIAALSSNVPTLSFGYSVKAKGINKDIFGHDNYCMNPEKLSSKTVADKIENILKESDEIRSHLKISIPKIKNKALLAGQGLQKITE
ncbi:polysaccharide pyruvyl transferase family protein [Methanosarcina sp.]|uniref:polysaccharide pyruvyl transferase family protein n=1 Tax=Methanosarcina sp. TaxID=2213 RepID=UPI003C785394